MSELAERGVGVVEYASGVRNQADVAVLRHLRSQTVQAGNARTMDLCDRYGCRLVEVSSHIGARPSHADWQGQVYRLTDDDPELVARYEDFWEATGYEGVKGDHARLGDRLCGVNCRHSFAPYIEGTPRMWSPTPDEDAGLDRDEVYKATQRQRAYERQIRQTKREIAALEDAGADASAKRAQLRLQQKRLRTLVSENSEFLRRQSWRESVTGYKATGFKAATHALRMPSSANVRLDTAGLKGAMSRSLVDRQTAAIDASIAKYSVIREAVEKYGMQVKYNPMLVTAVGTTSVDKEAGFVINFAKAPFSSRQTFNSAMKGLVGSYYMPASSKGAESYPGYHEMGHVLLYAMFASQNGRLPTEDEYPAFAQEAKSQILSLMSLAKGSHELSTYAQGLDPSDFAAECFANLNCGKVNAYGDAIRIWIERGGRA